MEIYKNMNKICTSIEQAKKLAKILPLESADMHYHYDNDFGELESIPTITEEDDHFVLFQDVPCWSLAALLDILAEQDFKVKSLKRNNEYQYNIDIPSRHCKIWFLSLLDAAFEMICWLLENKKL